MRERVENQLVDNMIAAYVDWRDTCRAVNNAYFGRAPPGSMPRSRSRGMPRRSTQRSLWPMSTPVWSGGSALWSRLTAIFRGRSIRRRGVRSHETCGLLGWPASARAGARFGERMA